ncbi:MAG: FUSC family protein [Marinomonas atlantica]|nr:FUSC family protein [Marinomonas atlantica]
MIKRAFKKVTIRTTLKSLVVLNKVSRPWHLPVTTGVTIGAPAVIGALTGTFNDAMIASLGAMVFLYMSPNRTTSRMLTMILCTFGFMACLTLATLAAVVPGLAPVGLFMIALAVIVITRYYCLPPPGSFFFILASCVAMAMPFDFSAIPMRVGLIALGGLWAVLMAFIYSLFTGAHKTTYTPVEVDPRVNAILLEALFLSVCISGSYAFALILSLDNPYWVPISCAAILQGATFRMVWHRNIHRIVGTSIGMLLASFIFSFHPSPIVLALLICVLQTIIEVFIVKNYALAVTFITPLTVIMAEITSTGMDASVLLEQRMIDIVLGSFIGFIAGAIFHRTSLFNSLEKKMDERSRLSELLFSRTHESNHSDQ